MGHVVLVIHLIVTLVMIVLILLQRSEGGGLGLGGGGGMGNFASVQSTANALTKATTYVAVAFFLTSITLAVVASHSGSSKSILDTTAPVSTSAPAEMTTAPVVPLVEKPLTKDVPKSATGKEAPPVPIAK